MAAGVVSANYQELEKIAQQFTSQQQQVQRLTQSLMATVDPLRRGGWVADAANQYYRSMDQDIFPSLKRLNIALGHSGDAVREIAHIFRQAEEDACAGLRADGAAVGWGAVSSEQIPNDTQFGGGAPKTIEDGDWVGVPPSAAKAIVVNGIQSNPDDLKGLMKSVSGALGGVDVMGVYNASAGSSKYLEQYTWPSFQGFVRDLGEAIVDKFQAHEAFRPGPENPAVQSLIKAIIESDGKAPIFAHSQGGAITAAALKELSMTDFDMTKLTVITMGTAEIDLPWGPHYTQYVHLNDVVPVGSTILNAPYYRFNPLTLAQTALIGNIRPSIVWNPDTVVSFNESVNHSVEAINGNGGYINEFTRDYREGKVNGL